MVYNAFITLGTWTWLNGPAKQGDIRDGRPLLTGNSAPNAFDIPVNLASTSPVQYAKCRNFASFNFNVLATAVGKRHPMLVWSSYCNLSSALVTMDISCKETYR